MPTIYQVTNLVNQKKYRTMHYGDFDSIKKAFKDNLKQYAEILRMCPTTEILDALMEYGYSNFKIVPIKVIEEDWVTREDAKETLSEIIQTMQDKWKIFKVVNRETNEFFIAATPGQLGAYRTGLRFGDPDGDKKKLLAAVKKYGIDNFHIELIEKLTGAEVDARVKELIETLKPAYN